MIEKCHAFGKIERVVERRAEHGRPEPDALRLGGGHGQRHFRRRMGLPAARMMLANKGFVEPQLFGIVDEADIALERQRRIFRGVMARHHKKREFHLYRSFGRSFGRFYFVSAPPG